MQQPYRVVLCSLEQRPLVAGLMKHLWSADTDLNAAYLDWKYQRNPYIREPLIYLALQGESVAGMRGCLGTKWNAGDLGEPVVLPYPDDLIVEPAHRAQNLHRRIMEFALSDLRARGYDYVVNLSATRYTMLASTRMKWRSAGHVGALARRTRRARTADRASDALRRLPFLWRWADPVADWAGPRGEHAFDRLDACLPARTSGASESLFVADQPLAAEMVRLIERLPADTRIRHVRDETYFGWRFANPFRRYRFLYAGSERLEGYLVLQTCVDVVSPRVSIVDWEAENDAVRAALLDAALSKGGLATTLAWACGMSPASEAILAERGFEAKVASHEHVILVRSLRDADPKAPWMLGGRRLDDAADWNLRMIYSMVG